MKINDPVFTFIIDNKKYAVSYDELEDGTTFDLEGHKLFLFRTAGVDIFYFTSVFIKMDQGFAL